MLTAPATAAVRIEDRRGEGEQRNAGTVRPLGDDLETADRAAFFQRHAIGHSEWGNGVASGQ